MVRILPPGETKEQTEARLRSIGHSDAEAKAIAGSTHAGKDHGGIKTVHVDDYTSPTPPPKGSDWRDNVSYEVSDPSPVDPNRPTRDERLADRGGYTFGPGGHPTAHTPDGKGGYTSAPVQYGDPNLKGDAAAYAKPLEVQLAELAARQDEAWSNPIGTPPGAYMRPGEWEFLRDRIQVEQPHLLDPPSLDSLQIRSSTGRPIQGGYHQPERVATQNLQDFGVPFQAAQLMANRAMQPHGLSQHASETTGLDGKGKEILEQRISNYYGALPSGFEPRFWDGTQGELNPLRDAIREHKDQVLQGRYVYIDDNGNEHYTDDPHEAAMKGTQGWYIDY